VGLRGELIARACEGPVGPWRPSWASRGDGRGRRGGGPVRGHQVRVANYNSPEQTVISGDVLSVKEVSLRLQGAGARRVLPLKSPAPSTRRPWLPRRGSWNPTCGWATIREPRVPFYSNVTGTQLDDPDAIRDAPRPPGGERREVEADLPGPSRTEG